MFRNVGHSARNTGRSARIPGQSFRQVLTAAGLGGPYKVRAVVHLHLFKMNLLSSEHCQRSEHAHRNATNRWKSLYKHSCLGFNIICGGRLLSTMQPHSYPTRTQPQQSLAKGPHFNVLRYLGLSLKHLTTHASSTRTRTALHQPASQIGTYCESRLLHGHAVLTQLQK